MITVKTTFRNNDFTVRHFFPSIEHMDSFFPWRVARRHTKACVTLRVRSLSHNVTAVTHRKRKKGKKFGTKQSAVSISTQLCGRNLSSRLSKDWIPVTFMMPTMLSVTVRWIYCFVTLYTYLSCQTSMSATQTNLFIVAIRFVKIL